ncbi:CHAT domain-containing protein [Nocardia vulneris]|uniref:CHAT domain-containing protein n=1 Tax=Nocardia vulneris TaxID=1141657 RepID=UPI0030CC19CF
MNEQTNPAQAHAMSFDGVHAQLRDRISRYPSDLDNVLDSVVVSEINALHAAANRDDQFALNAVLGHLYALRAARQSTAPQAHHDRAYSYLYLCHVASNPSAIPAEMAELVGLSADPRQQLSAGGDFLMAAHEFSDLTCARASIHILSAAISQLPMNAELANPMSWLSIAHVFVHRATGEMADVDEEVRFAAGAVAVTPAGSEERLRFAANLLASYEHHFKHSGDVDDLHRAIAVGEHVLSELPGPVGERARLLAVLATVYQLRSENGGDRTDLDKVIATRLAAIEASEESDPEYAARIVALSASYWDRYKSSNIVDDLEQAISYGEVALHNDPGPEDLLRSLSNLSVYYRTRFDDTHDPDLLNGAILTIELGLRSAPPGTADWVRLHGNLAAFYAERISLSGALADADRAIIHAQIAYHNTHPDHPDKERRLASLAICYRHRFDMTSQREDIDTCVVLTQQWCAASTEPEAAGERASQLAFELSRRFHVFDDRTDIDRAVEIHRFLVEVSTEDGDRAKHQVHLASVLRERFERYNDHNDSDEAVATASRAVPIAPEGEIRAAALGALASAYGARYQRRGARTDLDHAIEFGRQQLLLLDNSDPMYPTAVSNHARSLFNRYELSGAAIDLNESIARLERAVAVGGGSRPRRRGEVLALARGLRGRALRRDSVAGDLDRAIALLRAVVTETAPDDRELPTYLDALANALSQRFGSDSDSDRTDIDEAIELQVRASNHAHGRHRGQLLNNLANSFFRRFDRFAERSDLDNAIALCEATINPGYPTEGSVSMLAQLYSARIAAGGAPPAQSRFDDLVSRAEPNATQVPETRLLRAFRVGRLAVALDDHRTAARLLDCAIAQIPETISREITGADQDFRVSGYESLVAESIEAHCNTGDILGAVRIAEFGRCIALGRNIDILDDLSQLAGTHPDLAQELTAVRTALTSPENALADGKLDPVAHRAALWQEHDHLIRRIQASGYPEFGTLPPVERLMSDLPGPVVIVAAGQQSGHAIVLSANQPPQYVRVFGLTHDVARRHAVNLAVAQYVIATGGGIEELHTAVRKALAWLWDTVALAVVRSINLNLVGSSNGPPPRVWWMPVGVMSLLPIHAAAPPGRAGVLDAVISSYTPTLRALRHYHARPHSKKRRLLAVQVANASGLRPLPFTATESIWLRKLFADIMVLSDEQATKAQVLTLLPDATWVHMSCHATADILTPSRSGLNLCDGLLALPEISNLRLEQAEIIFLSACSTAQHGVLQADEIFTLGTAFHMAGFRHVISSQWPLFDQVASVAAHAFYTAMPSTLSNADTAASVLNKVVRRLRSEAPERPELWASFVHSGP